MLIWCGILGSQNAVCMQGAGSSQQLSPAVLSSLRDTLQAGQFASALAVLREQAKEM